MHATWGGWGHGVGGTCKRKAITLCSWGLVWRWGGVGLGGRGWSCYLYTEGDDIMLVCILIALLLKHTRVRVDRYETEAMREDLELSKV